MFTKILLFMLMALSVMVHSLNVPFDLLNWASVTQNGSPVTAGIPLPQGAVTDLSKLRITDASGNTVPAQFRALNRWWWEKNKLGTSQPSLKWVLCDFQPSTVTAKSVLSGYTLRDDFSGSTPTTQLNLTDASDKITVSTGPLKFTVNKLHFNLFDELWLDANSNSTFESNEQIITSNMQNGGTIIAGDWVAGECVNGTIHRSSESAPRFVTIEEQGPMKVVIKIEGNHYAPSNGVKMGLYGYQCFITAYSGKAFVDVQWLVTNYTIVGVPAAVKYSYISWPFSKYTLNLGLNISATQYAILGDSTEFAGAIGASDSIKLIQKRSSFTLSNTAGGKLAQGGAMLTNGQLGISVACRDFAPNNPKGITLTNNNLALELFPDTGLSKYWIDPNARKNHRMRFEFFKGNYIAGNLS
ncbi:MAG: hypothetical protein JNL74_18220, partial [Fibrobacteres bacterium]|nr:hypothetical protein [Fibrobacterota bacterium]